MSDCSVNSSVLYALCILPFSNSIEFACPVEYEWTWICHIETKTLKVIGHSNQLSCCSAMRIHCLKLKRLQKAWSRMKKCGPCMKKSEVDPKLIHSLELNRDVSDSCLKRNVTKNKHMLMLKVIDILKAVLYHSKIKKKQIT